MTQDWERIRRERTDLTDYVIHFTKRRMLPQEEWAAAGTLMFKPIEVLLQILDDGFIRPSFAPLGNRYDNTPRPTIYGPDPAICFTEQTLASVVECSVTTNRYSGFGIAYHKVLIHEQGGRPVIYGTEEFLGSRIAQNEDGFEKGKRIYQGGLAAGDQYLFARYEPGVPGSGEHPLDFMWEREWRIKPRNRVLPVALEHSGLRERGIYTGAIIVERDGDAEIVRAKLYELEAAGKSWVSSVGRIISLDEVKRRLAAGEKDCARIETWTDVAKPSEQMAVKSET